MPWIESAVARRSGNLFDSDAAAVGCQSDVPSPTRPEPTSAQKSEGAAPIRKYANAIAASADARVKPRRRTGASVSMPTGRSSVPCANCRAELSAPTCTSSRPSPALIDGMTTGKSCWNQWMKKWPPVMTERNLTRSGPMARTAPRSAALFNGGFLRRAAGAREVLRLDFLRVELGRGLVHALECLVEVERRGVLRAEAHRVQARDDEAPEIRARHAARFERLDFLHDEVVERHERLGARGADLERLDFVHALECLVEVERRGVLRAEAQRVQARDDEAPEIRARHAARFERLDFLHDEV